MTLRERVKLERIAENTNDENACKEAMLKLLADNPTYHWCPEWDYMVISDNHKEWICCLCDIKHKTKPI